MDDTHHQSTDHLHFDGIINLEDGVSWCINFTKPDVSGCAITFGPDDVERCAREMGTPWNKRHFVVAPHPELSKHTVVQLGNNRFTLPDAAVEDLAEVMDGYLKKVGLHYS